MRPPRTNILVNLSTMIWLDWKGNIRNGKKVTFIYSENIYSGTIITIFVQFPGLET